MIRKLRPETRVARMRPDEYLATTAEAWRVTGARSSSPSGIGSTAS